ncbi:MAG: 3'-5' exonuclease [Betaproteobacteria bacterium]|nr:3'-5' exonuclease [Betaproteobacteria bacterium]
MNRKLSILILALLPLLTLIAAMAAVHSQIPADQREAFMALLVGQTPFAMLIGCFAAGVAGVLAWRQISCPARASLLLADRLELASKVNAAPGVESVPDKLLLESDAGPEIRVLTERIERLLTELHATRRNAAEQAAAAKQSVERERNQFATLVAELPQGVIACNKEGRVLLYNSRVRDLVGGFLLGLGRPLAAVFDPRLVAHAEERIQQRLAANAAHVQVSFVTVTNAGRLVRVRVSPVAPAGAEPVAQRLSGFLALIDDVTREAEQTIKRDRLLELLTQSQRASAAVIHLAAESLSGFEQMSQIQRARIVEQISSESTLLLDRINAATPEVSELLRSATRLEAMQGADLVSSAARRIEAKTDLTVHIEALENDVWLRVESFALVQVLVGLARRLQDAQDLRELRLSLSLLDSMACIELAWIGFGIANETAASWEIEPLALAGEASSRSIREVLAQHQADIAYGRDKVRARSYFRIMLPLGDPDENEGRLSSDEARPEFYDFDLFAWSVKGAALDERLLSELAYTVFDTETTGLNPSGGDEIIQIGAVRILNGRLLRGERFDQLIDPERNIDPAAEAIHGISRASLLGKPKIGEVLTSFHAFARDTVLVGHNAAFDMRFLQIKEASTGLRFDQPVLDTLLLSAVLHPNQETHRLEAIAERFGVPVQGRHDASGDAQVTAQLFLRMLPLLAERGIRTLAQARKASEKTFQARIKY